MAQADGGGEQPGCWARTLGRCCGRSGAGEEVRVVYVNETHQEHAKAHHKSYSGNYVSTTKYNLLTFLPKALFEQYRWAGRAAVSGVSRAGTAGCSWAAAPSGCGHGAGWCAGTGRGCDGGVVWQGRRHVAWLQVDGRLASAASV